MMTLLVVSFLVGAVLGQGFKIFVLAPSFLIAMLLAIATGFAHVDTVWSVVLMAATIAIGMQFGYLFGICIRLVLGVALARLHLASTSARHPAR